MVNEIKNSKSKFSEKITGKVIINFFKRTFIKAQKIKFIEFF